MEVVVGVGGFSCLYCSFDELCSLLSEYRLFWVVDFIHETTNDLLNDHAKILTERETAVCRVLSSASYCKSTKRLPVGILRRSVAQALYEVFKICRKLSIEDKEIVVENFNLNKIERRF